MRLAATLVLLTAADAAYADDAPPPPAWAADRAKVPDADRKVEGGFLDALPLVGYDTNTGLGLGLGGHYTLTGSRTDPLFAYTPYRHRFFAQTWLTTGGFQDHFVNYDGFYV